MALLEPGEAADAYKAKILGYQAGADFLALLAAAPEQLASLTGGLSAEDSLPGCCCAPRMSAKAMAPRHSVSV